MFSVNQRKTNKQTKDYAVLKGKAQLRLEVKGVVSTVSPLDVVVVHCMNATANQRCVFGCFYSPYFGVPKNVNIYLGYNHFADNVESRHKCITHIASERMSTFDVCQ